MASSLEIHGKRQNGQPLPFKQALGAAHVKGTGHQQHPSFVAAQQRRHGTRFLRRAKVTGEVVNAKGEVTSIEMFGPQNIEAWNT